MIWLGTYLPLGGLAKLSNVGCVNIVIYYTYFNYCIISVLIEIPVGVCYTYYKLAHN